MGNCLKHSRTSERQECKKINRCGNQYTRKSRDKSEGLTFVHKDSKEDELRDDGKVLNINTTQAALKTYPIL